MPDADKVEVTRHPFPETLAGRFFITEPPRKPFPPIIRLSCVTNFSETLEMESLMNVPY